jgi:DNA-directed RNA polymerase specialized sigma24 family protein
VRFDEVIGLWDEGQRRLNEADPADRAALERVTDEIVDELRRRLGGPFSAEDLAQLYGEAGTDWCFDVATRAAPDNPGAWDLTTVAGAAFGRYLREAMDYAGGRRVEEVP